MRYSYVDWMSLIPIPIWDHLRNWQEWENGKFSYGWIWLLVNGFGTHRQRSALNRKEKKRKWKPETLACAWSIQESLSVREAWECFPTYIIILALCAPYVVCSIVLKHFSSLVFALTSTASCLVQLPLWQITWNFNLSN